MHVGTPQRVKKAAWIVAGAGLAVIALASLFVFVVRSIGDVPTVGLGLPGRAFLLGVLLVGFGFIPKMPGKGFLAGIGVFLVLIGLFGLFLLPEIGASQEERKAERTAAAQAAREPQEFILNAGEERFVCRVGPGTQHRIRADRPWVALSRDDRNGTYEGPGGKYRLENYGAGEIIWYGAAPAAPLLVKGVEDNTTLTCERVDR